MRSCWCGCADFAPFNDDYGVCRECGTLVSRNSLSDAQLRVEDDEVDFYGKQYWLGHQADDLGFPDIRARARSDLTERNLHWLRVLLKYRLPPGRALELGCAHGSFVALMRQAGFDARGIEMSAWVVAFGRQTFGVQIDVGPVERLGLQEGSLDVIALMDVLEHLPDPRATMRHCLDLLAPDGILLIQTPQFKQGMAYQELVARDDAFLAQLKADEHLYLLTEQSFERLFRTLGVDHVRFEPAIFAMYDMFAVVSRSPLNALPDEAADEALQATPEGRVALALLDVRKRECAADARAFVCDADRLARGDQVVTLTRMLAESEADRGARGTRMDELTDMLKESDADRRARGEHLDALNATLAACEQDRLARGHQVDTLNGLIAEVEIDRALRATQIEELTIMLRDASIKRDSFNRQVEDLNAAIHGPEGFNVRNVELRADVDRLQGAAADSAKALEALERELLACRQRRARMEHDLQALLARRDFQAIQALRRWPEVHRLLADLGRTDA